MELYLDLRDVENELAVENTLRAVRECTAGADFIWLVEGPIRSLDGEFFDLTRDAAADRELVSLLGEVATAIGAQTINIHAIAPRAMDSDCGDATRSRALERAIPFVQFFADECVARSLIPTLENMPPVLRMREGGYYISPIGLAPEDLTLLVGHAPSARVCLDYSHAQLYINASHMAQKGQGLEQFPDLAAMLRQKPSPATVTSYRERLGSALLACHVSNATGLLGEGEPYDTGDVDFDYEIPAAADQVTYFVTETLEPDPANARFMRLAQEQLCASTGSPHP